MKTFPVLVAAFAAALGAKADYASSDYSQTGLVGQWDGIENAGVGLHDATTNRWTDLTGTTGDFVLQTGKAAFTENGLRKTAGGWLAEIATKRTDVRTIEVVVSGVPDTGWVNALYISANQTITFGNSKGANGTRQLFFDYDNLGMNTSVKPAAQTICVTYNANATKKGQDFWQNGATPEGEEIKQHWNNSHEVNKMFLGGRGIDYFIEHNAEDNATFGYTIHAVRLYSRVLTQQEAVRHTMIDQARFFGGETSFPERTLSGQVAQSAIRAKAGAGGRISIDDASVAPAVEDQSAWFNLGTTTAFICRAIPLPGWTFSGWTVSPGVTIVRGSASEPVIGVEAAFAHALTATFMKQEDGLSYVQDGLVGWWDGLENAGPGIFQPGATTWKDLTGKTGDFAVNTASAAFRNNGLYKKAAGYMASMSTNQTGILTVEAAVSDLPTANSALIVLFQNQQTVTVLAQSETSRQYFFDNKVLGWQTTERPKDETIAVTYQKSGSAYQGTDFRVNARKPVGSSLPNYWNGVTGKTCIGGRTTSSAGKSDWDGKGYTIHALRYYDRALSAGEIAYNNAVDRRRFHGAAEAEFTYRLTANGTVERCVRGWTAGASGTVSLDNGEAGASVETDWSECGSAVHATLKATPAAGWRFVSWTGDVHAIVGGEATDATVEVETTLGASLQAVFEKRTAYVTEGLIGHWDAIENAGPGVHETEPMVWKDLTGKTGDFHLNAVAATFEENALVKSGYGRMAFIPETRTDIRTIEVVLSGVPPVDTWTMPFYNTYQQHISILGNTRQMFFDYDHYGLLASEPFPEQMTFALTCSSATSASACFINGLTPEGTAKTAYWRESADNPDCLALGARWNGQKECSTTGFRIHAVRLYNRVLTAEELAKNARRDGMRFFGKGIGLFIVFK